MLNSLRIERDRIALEASLSLNLSGLLKDVFPSIVAGFSSFVAGFAPDTPAIQLTSKQAEFVREISKRPYMEIRALAAYVPEGLDVTYLQYITKLEPAVAHAVKIVDTLSAYSTFLAQLVCNVDQKLSTASMTRPFTELEKAREKANAALGGCFVKGSTRSEVTLMDVIARHNDWTPLFHRSDELTKQVNTVDRKALSKKVAECADLLERVMAMIEKDQLVGVTPQTVTNLANGAYTAASELEFFVVTYYKAAALGASIMRTVDHARKVFNH